MKFDLEQVAEEIANDKQFWEELTQIATDWYNKKNRRSEQGG